MRNGRWDGYSSAAASVGQDNLAYDTVQVPVLYSSISTCAVQVLASAFLCWKGLFVSNTETASFANLQVSHSSTNIIIIIFYDTMLVQRQHFVNNTGTLDIPTTNEHALALPPKHPCSFRLMPDEGEKLSCRPRSPRASCKWCPGNPWPTYSS